jgi:TldD protein
MPSLRDSEADLARSLARLEPRTPYAEVMAERAWGHTLRLDKRTTTPRPRPHLEGAVFRVWAGDHWLESATSGLGAHSLSSSLEGLLRQLTGDLPTHGPPGESATGSAERAIQERRPIADFGLPERLEWAKTRHAWAMEVEGVDDAFVAVGTDYNERLFLNTAGARRLQTMSHVLGSVAVIATEGGRVEFDVVQRGATGGVEVLDQVGEPEIRKAGTEARALLAAKAPPTGTMNVILDPSTTGTFAHESFGHGTEADQLLRGRSYLQPLLGQMVAPESLTLIDDGSYEGAWGSIFFDDEGFPAQRTTLVEKGRFVGVLHDRESAAVFRRPPTGNARRSDFLSRPFVRMTNTYVEPGDRTLEELVSETRDGVLLENFTSGIEDPLGGNMQLKVKKGRRIERGELTEIFSSMALSGKVLEFLRNIRGVSGKGDFALGAGFCGKGHTDILPTSTGGPYLASRAVVGPA